MGKVSHWNYIRSQVKKDFERAGIQRCEMCGSGMYLSFAHRKKRRFITDDNELRTVALLCVPCHTQIEHKPHEEMYEIVTSIIEARTI